MFNHQRAALRMINKCVELNTYNPLGSRAECVVLGGWGKGQQPASQLAPGIIMGGRGHPPLTSYNMLGKGSVVDEPLPSGVD